MAVDETRFFMGKRNRKDMYLSDSPWPVCVHCGIRTPCVGKASWSFFFHMINV